AASMQIPAGATPPAHSRRLDRPPSWAISKAVSLPAKDSDMMSVAPSGATTIPFGERDALGHLIVVAQRSRAAARADGSWSWSPRRRAGHGHRPGASGPASRDRGPRHPRSDFHTEERQRSGCARWDGWGRAK